MFPERRNMTIDIAPGKNPAAGWDITTSIATTAQAEKVTRVRIQINDFPEYDKAIDPPADFWKNTLNPTGRLPRQQSRRRHRHQQPRQRHGRHQRVELTRASALCWTWQE